MFEIYSFEGKRCSIELGNNRTMGPNRIDVLVGPNGSGKTEVLSALAQEYAGVNVRRNAVQATSIPRRVISQTLSPFSRFPAPSRLKVSLSEIYRDEQLNQSRYIPIGMYRGIRFFAGSFSRNIVERAVFSISENIERTEIVGRILRYLEYQAEIELYYMPKVDLREIIRAAKGGSLDLHLEEIIDRDLHNHSVLKREIMEQGVREVSNLIRTAIELFDDRMLRGGIHHRIGFFGTSKSISYAELQALSLLRRLNLLTLKECALRRNDGSPVEISSASSGQQQLLCTLFGLAGEIEDESLILIDEPELSLHPTWQISFLEHLESLMRAVRGCHVIVASHSPLIVQKAQELGYNIHTMSEGRLDSVTTVLSEGNSVEATLIDVFESPVPKSLYLSEEIIRVVNEVECGGEIEMSLANARLEELKVIYEGSEELGIISMAAKFINAKEDYSEENSTGVAE